MKRRMFFVIVLLALFASLFWLTTTRAQTPIHRMAMWVISSSSTSQNNSYTLNGIAGQPQVGIQVAGATFRVDGGFWPDTTKAPQLYLPIIANDPTPTPTTPPPQPLRWERVGPGGLEVSALAIQGNSLFAADRRGIEKGGGLYRRTIASCNLSEGWIRIDAIPFSVLDVDFRGNLGVAAAFDNTNGIFYSTDNGASWQKAATAVREPRTIALAAANVFHVGTDADGIYRSENGGVTWLQRSTEPQLINVIALSANTLWIGVNAVTQGQDDVIVDASKAGVWALTIGSSTPIQSIAGLSDGRSRQVWDFLFQGTEDSDIYLATYNGVFRGNGSTPWIAFGLQGRQLLSLATFRGSIYAGERILNKDVNAGLWRRPLTGSDWEPVPAGNWNKSYAIRDLLVDATHCNGLLAATEDGVWLYR